jgi:hypothetical protein
MLMFAVLARERWRLFGPLSLPFLLCLVAVHGSAAFAASLNVKIRQVNPNGEIQQVTCSEKKKCVLPIDIQTGQAKETLTVGIGFVRGNVLLKFQTPKGYLYAGDKNPADKQNAMYETVWHEGVTAGKPSTSNVTLFLPLVPEPVTASILDSPQQAVADLEINVAVSQ